MVDQKRYIMPQMPQCRYIPQAGQQELLQGERLSTTVKVRESDSWCFPFDHLTTYQPFPCSQETYQKVSNDTVRAVHKGMLPYKVVNNAILPLKIKTGTRPALRGGYIARPFPGGLAPANVPAAQLSALSTAANRQNRQHDCVNHYRVKQQ